MLHTYTYLNSFEIIICSKRIDMKTRYRKVASSRPVYYSKVIGQRPKVTVHKDQISPS